MVCMGCDCPRSDVAGARVAQLGGQAGGAGTGFRRWPVGYSDMMEYRKVRSWPGRGRGTRVV